MSENESHKNSIIREDVNKMNKPTTVAQLIDEYLADGSLVDGSSAFSAQLVRKLEVCKGWIGEECINAITSSRLQKMLQDGHVF